MFHSLSVLIAVAFVICVFSSDQKLPDIDDYGDIVVIKNTKGDESLISCTEFLQNNKRLMEDSNTDERDSMMEKCISLDRILHDATTPVPSMVPTFAPMTSDPAQLLEARRGGGGGGRGSSGGGSGSKSSSGSTASTSSTTSISSGGSTSSLSTSKTTDSTEGGSTPTASTPSSPTTMTSPTLLYAGRPTSASRTNSTSSSGDMMHMYSIAVSQAFSLLLVLLFM
jgi:hypothetical protein